MEEKQITVEKAMREHYFEGKRILLVEDNEVDMEIAEMLLCQLGIQADCVWNGKEALMQYRNSKPGYYDLILLDIAGPAVDGVRTAREIRKLYEKDVKIIAFTTNASRQEQKHYQDAGIDECLKKPSGLKEMCRMLGKWL